MFLIWAMCMGLGLHQISVKGTWPDFILAIEQDQTLKRIKNGTVRPDQCQNVLIILNNCITAPTQAIPSPEWQAHYPVLVNYGSVRRYIPWCFWYKRKQKRDCPCAWPNWLAERCTKWRVSTSLRCRVHPMMCSSIMLILSSNSPEIAVGGSSLQPVQLQGRPLLVSAS